MPSYIGNIQEVRDGRVVGQRIGYHSHKHRKLIIRWAIAKGWKGYQIHISNQWLIHHSPGSNNNTVIVEAQPGLKS